MKTNNTTFCDFLSTLQTTNATLDFFVDFEKCLNNTRQISIKLNCLNYLLGKKDLKSEIRELFSENPKCFEVLNLLIAVRDSKTKIIYDNAIKELKNYFTNANDVYEFFIQTGLCELFQNRYISNLNDYVFGIEVGLDTNARKNRSGKNMEKLIAQIFTKNNINFNEQVSINALDINLGSDNKVFDFEIKTAKTIYLIECNFYSTGGSKLNEVARSYIEISEKISKYNNFKFVWITDGKGWLDAKNKLEEAYKSIEIYNISNIDNFIKKVKCEA